MPPCVISDLSTSLSSLSLTTSAHLQDQKERESLRSHYQLPASADEPLTAPTPTRATVAAPPPVSGMWTPEMGIKFSSGPSAQKSGEGAGALGQGPSSSNSRDLQYPDAGRGSRVQAGPWDVSRGLRFA